MSQVSQLLVVGLGNIPYPLTRHSVGHLVVESLAKRMSASPHFSSNRAMGGLIMAGELPMARGANLHLTLIKPKALMNITGPCVSMALRELNMPPSSMVVIHDSLEHAPNTIRPKSSGSANGHNGIKSIITALGGDTNFHRLRIGIGRGSGNVANYVLGPLSEEELQYWSQDGAGIPLVAKELERISKIVKTSK